MNTTKTALITGASSGIGRALAFEFARNGYHLILTARETERLERVSTEVKQKFAVECEIITSDLSKHPIDQKLIALFDQRAIDVLVNNAGFGIHGDFSHTSLEDEHRMVNLQIQSMLGLTKHAVKGMKKRKSGAILNIASVYSFAPVPFQSVYGACKAFLVSFSASLSNELVPYGISVTASCPGITHTEFRKRSGVESGRSTLKSGMSAEAVARVTYNDFSKKKLISVPGLVNRLFVTVARLIPLNVLTALLRLVNQFRGVNAKHS